MTLCNNIYSGLSHSGNPPHIWNFVIIIIFVMVACDQQSNNLWCHYYTMTRWRLRWWLSLCTNKAIFNYKKNSAFHWFLNSFGMKSKFLSITNNPPYDLVSAYLLCSVFRLSWSHLPPSQVPCAPVTWKDPHVQTRHTSPISMPLCTVPFYKVGPPPLSTSPMTHVMELLFLSACFSLPLVYEFLGNQNDDTTFVLKDHCSS